MRNFSGGVLFSKVDEPIGWRLRLAIQVMLPYFISFAKLIYICVLRFSNLNPDIIRGKNVASLQV